MEPSPAGGRQSERAGVHSGADGRSGSPCAVIRRHEDSRKPDSLSGFCLLGPQVARDVFDRRVLGKFFPLGIAGDIDFEMVRDVV